jgi:hypothetical protein
MDQYTKVHTVGKSVFTSLFAIAILFPILSVGCGGHGASSTGGVTVKQIATKQDLIGSRGASGRYGDYILKNNHVRFIVQNPLNSSDQERIEVDLFAPFGGTLIDADIQREPGKKGDDLVGKVSLIYNFGRTARYHDVQIIDDGSLSGSAILELVGRDALVPVLNIKTALDDFLPGASSILFASADPDESLPLEIRTRYILGAQDQAVRIETYFRNTGSQRIPLVAGDAIRSSRGTQSFLTARKGLLDLAPSPGFGSRKDEFGYSEAQWLGFEGSGTSMGYLPVGFDLPSDSTDASCVSFSGLFFCLSDVEFTTTQISGDGSSTDLQYVEPGSEEMLVRYVGVGKGGLSSVSNAFAQIIGETAKVLGTVSDSAGNPATDASIAVLRKYEDLWLPYTHVKTDNLGAYEIKVPTGEYKFAAHSLASGIASPGQFALEGNAKVVAGNTYELDPFVFPDSATIDLFVVDDRQNPAPSKIWIFGDDGAIPKVAVNDSQASFFAETTSASGYNLAPWKDLTTDPLLHTTELREIRDWQGDQASVKNAFYGKLAGLDGRLKIEIEPGTWTLVASKGPEYAYDLTTISVAANQEQVVVLQVPKVVSSLGTVSADFHVHAGNSPDSVVPVEDRALSAAAEGLDLFVATDHGFRSDFSSIIQNVALDSDGSGRANLKLEDHVKSIVGEEITTWDLGHFNAFPFVAGPVPPYDLELLGQDESVQSARAPTENGGALQWWTEDDGTALSKTSQQIFSELREDLGESSIVQVNHAFQSSFQGHFERIGLGFDFSQDYTNQDSQKAITAALDTNTELLEQYRLGDVQTYGNDFDALELSVHQDKDMFWWTLAHWFGFLNLGKPVIATGNSDSHTVLSHPVGLPRNDVNIPELETDDVRAVESPQLLSALKEGRSVVNNGYHLHVTALVSTYNNVNTQISIREATVSSIPAIALRTNDGVSGLSQADLDAGFSVQVTLYADIQSPDWIVPETVYVFQNTKHMAEPESSTTQYRNHILAEASQSYRFGSVGTDPRLNFEKAIVQFSDEVTRSSKAMRYRAKVPFTFTLDTVDELVDSWFVVFVDGSADDLAYPILYDGDQLGNPYSLSNPIWVDIDGQGWESSCKVRDC